MTRYAGRLPRTYAQAEQMLGGKNHRTILNNTTINRYIDGDIEVQYHGNAIATFEPDGTLMLTNCGYGTVSTRERLNAMAPAHVSFVQRDHAQQVRVWIGDGVPEGVIPGGTVRIDRDGCVSA